jgi:hypothetical protein
MGALCAGHHVRLQHAVGALHVPCPAVERLPEGRYLRPLDVARRRPQHASPGSLGCAHRLLALPGHISVEVPRRGVFRGLSRDIGRLLAGRRKPRRPQPCQHSKLGCRGGVWEPREEAARGFGAGVVLYRTKRSSGEISGRSAESHVCLVRHGEAYPALLWQSRRPERAGAVLPILLHPYQG